MLIILKMCIAVFMALLVAASVESAATGITPGPVTQEPVTYEYFDTTDYGVYPFLFPRNVTCEHSDLSLLARDCDQYGFNCGYAPFDPTNSWKVLYHLRSACSCYGRKRCLRYKKSWYLGFWQYRCEVPTAWPLYEK
ncbi:uncharacterized protein LOC119066924 isoform X4 [Bradysia coprophila]|uniref:uncharacterized protein LOC119066924 isoform X4 n=1 Tax=Bradysia coprophila TaxID=38358 RepID=UPI00187D7F69|nr:uncharacterized protein LOC119066924 isoform X4 [Bradysia coprophila]